MIKSTIAAAAVLAFSAPAFAGPYVNVESNSGFAGSDYTGGLVESHLGYEGEGKGTSWYVQSGPALVLTDGADSEIELSGKVGGAVVAGRQSSCVDPKRHKLSPQSPGTGGRRDVVHDAVGGVQGITSSVLTSG